MKKSAWWKGLIKYALGFGLLAFVLWKNWPQLETLFRQTPNLLPLLAALLITIGCTAIQFYRWYLLVQALGLPFSLRDAIRLGLVGFFYNTFLPGSVGGDFLKAFFIARGHPARKAAAVATVVADRLVGLFGLILYVAVVGGGCWLNGDERIAENEYLQTAIRSCVVIVASTVGGWIVLGLLSHRAADRLASWLHRLPKVGPSLAELWFTLRTYRAKPRTVLTVIGLSAIVHTGFVLNFHLAVQVFPPENPALLGSLPEHFVIAPIGYIGQALFPAPGGVGGAEAIFGYLYEVIRGKDAIAAGLQAKDAFAVGVAGRLSLRIIEWSLGLVGYIAYLRMKDELTPTEEPPKDKLA